MVQKSRAHIRYKNSDGKVVPGVTTILDIMAKPALIKWANNLGLQGIDSSKYRDEMADIGTLAHALIMCELKEDLDATADYLVNYSASQIVLAENALRSFHSWKNGHDVEPILVEEPLVSEMMQVGGTIDLYAKVDGLYTLVDFKTGNAIYFEAQCQVAAYVYILVEHGHMVEQTRLLRIGRTPDEGFEEMVPACRPQHLALFKHCREIYELRKELNRK